MHGVFCYILFNTNQYHHSLLLYNDNGVENVSSFDYFFYQFGQCHHRFGVDTKINRHVNSTEMEGGTSPLEQKQSNRTAPLDSRCIRFEFLLFFHHFHRVELLCSFLCALFDI